MTIAHAGGLDEILIAGAVVAVLFLLRRPRGSPGEAPRDGPCLYCGARLRAADTRCPSCGFRAAPGPTSSSNDEGR
jgi:hypothetical protein